MKAARELAGLRKKIWHTCPIPCGKKFRAIKKAVYCSNACRQKAKYRRTRERPKKRTPSHFLVN